MKAVIQRVSWAKVHVNGDVVGRCGPGLLVLIGASRQDNKAIAEKLALKILGLRIFDDSQGKINLALSDVLFSDDPQILVVSNFTLYGDVTKSKRPSFTQAAAYDNGNVLYEHFITCLREHHVKVESGVYGAEMQVELMNDGPVTLVVEL